jgi:hypothetical protein
MLNANDIFTPATLDKAYAWLCKQRANFLDSLAFGHKKKIHH